MKPNEKQKELISLIDGRAELEGKNLTKSQELVYAALYFRSQGYTQMKEQTAGWFTQSNDQLLQLTGIGSKTTLTGSIRKLIDLGLIERKEGTIKGKLASSYRLSFDKKCTDESVPMDFAKCTDEERLNFLKEKKLNKSVPMKCTGTEKQKCTIDIDIEVDKEKENRDSMENLELKETELEKALKRIEELETKVTFWEMNLQTLFKTVGELVTRMNTILQNPSNYIPSATAGENVPSTGMNDTPQGATPSNGRFSKQEAEELEKSFNFFIRNLRNYDLQEQERMMENFLSRARATYTGKWIEEKVSWMKNSYSGMYKSINGKDPSKEQTANSRPATQPSNNGLGETEIYQQIANTFSVENYSPSTANKSRERLQDTIANGNITSEQKKNLLSYLMNLSTERWNEHQAQKEAQDTPSTTNEDNDTVNVTESAYEPKNALPEPDKNTNTDTGLSPSSEYFKLTYEANQLASKSEANDFLMNNKEKINALSAEQRTKLADVCRKFMIA